MEFDDLMTDRVSIRTRDGKTYADVPASVTRGKIFTQRTDIPIQPGDEVIRRTPAGIEEVFVVEDPGLQGGFKGIIPAAYEMRVRRADAPRSSRPASTVIYNVTGPNSRFNINSVDSSTNVVNQAPTELFQALREAIQSIVSVSERERLLARAVDLENEIGKPGYAQRYAQFMELAAHHVEALGPFLPALTQLLAGWLQGN